MEIKANLIPLSQIRPNPNQPRRNFDQAKLEELAQSIKDYGVIQPILLAPREDESGVHYLIVAGERRWRASEIAGLPEIPANIQTMDDLKVREVSLIENIQREALDPIEEATAYVELMGIHGCTQEELAEKLGKSQGEISNKIRLLNLSEEVKDAVSTGELSATHARTIAAVKDPKKQTEIAQKVKKDKANVKKTEELVKEAKAEEKLKEQYAPFIEKAKKKNRKFLFHFPFDKGVPAVEYSELLDKSLCKDCADAASMVEGQNLVDLCTNRDCFIELKALVRAEAERKAIEKAIKQVEAEGKIPVVASTVSEYSAMTNAKFDRNECYDCNSCRLLVSAENEPQEVCLNQTCFEQKLIEYQEALELQKKQDYEKYLNKWYGSLQGGGKPDQLAVTLFTLYSLLTFEGYVTEPVIDELHRLWDFEKGIEPGLGAFLAIEDSERLTTMLIQLTFAMHKAWYELDPSGCQEDTQTWDAISLMTGKEPGNITKEEVEPEAPAIGTGFWHEVRESVNVLAVKDWNPSKGKVKELVQTLNHKELQFCAKVETRDNVKKALMAELKRKGLNLPEEPTELPGLKAEGFQEDNTSNVA